MSGRLAQGCTFALLIAFAPMLLAQETICDPGDTEVRRLVFEGNETFRDAELAARIATERSSTLYKAIRILGARHCLDRVELPNDVERLRRLYERHGFRAASVAMDTIRSGADAVDVRFRINEGAPTLIRKLTFTGLDSVADADRVRRVMTLREGHRLDLENLARVKVGMERVLADIGYPRANVAQSYETDSGTVSLNVLPGALSRVERIVIDVDTTGGARWRISDGVVRGLLGFKEGDRFSLARLEEARTNLFRTGAYDRTVVELAPDSLQPPNDSLVIVVVTLRELVPVEGTTGVGWGTLDCFRGRATAVYRNFLGGARRMEASLGVSKIGVGYPLDFAEGLCTRTVRNDIYSDTLNYRLGFTLRQPGLFGLNPRYVPSLSIYSEERSEYFAYFRSVPIGGVVTFPRELANDRALTLAYQLEYGRTEAQPAIYCAVFNICTEEERARVRLRQRLSVASASLVQDRSIGGGAVARLDARHASTIIGSDPSLQFNTLNGDVRRVVPLNSSVEFAVRLGAGIVFGRGIGVQGTGVAGQSASRYVPPQERLYAGGPNSVRGFGYNGLGPLVYVVDNLDIVPADGDTAFFRAVEGTAPRRTVPSGGNTMLVGNVEARIVSPFLPTVLQYAAFVDIGEVWNRGSDSSAAAGFSGVKFTPGLGIRVTTPVGPFRVDVGYNPYQRRNGFAYYESEVQPNGTAPLYCVSPANTLKVVGGTVPPSPGEATQIAGSGVCGATYAPPPRSLLQRLTFNFSIGQAF